jgi:hypothetical protein
MNERLKYVLIAVNVSLIGCCSSALALDYPSAGVVPNRTPLVTREVQPDPDILMNSTVIRDESDVLDALVGVSKLGDYRYEVAPGQLQAMPSAQSMSGSIQLKLVTNPRDGSYDITDGTLLVQFNNDATDPAAFAEEYGLEKLFYFPNMKTVSVRSQHFQGLEQLIITLRADARVNSVTLDVIDPKIMPE